MAKSIIKRDIKGMPDWVKAILMKALEEYLPREGAVIITSKIGEKPPVAIEITDKTDVTDITAEVPLKLFYDLFEDA